MAYKDKGRKKLKGKEWWDNNQDKIKAYREAHGEERNTYSKEYHKQHREIRNEWARDYRRKNKARVVEHYSSGTNKCICCGFSDIRALQVDHINGGGEEHRRGIKQDFYMWLIKSDFPSGFQILCANCNVIKMSENNERANKWLKAEGK